VKITILGCGAAGGVPALGAGWGRCDPANPKNRRLRPSVLIQEQGKTLLVDTSPDLREQLLSADIRHLDAVLYSHAHADHLHGIDDLREINRAMRAPIPVFATAQTLQEIDRRFDYVFTPLDLDTSTIYKPWLIANPIEEEFAAAGIEVTAFDQDHGYSRTTGFRIGKFAYSTDVLELPEESMAKLHGLDLWIVGCLVDKPHNTHADIDKALRWNDILKPKRLVITHMSAVLDYAALAARLPPGIEPAYDGMVIEI